MFRVSNSIINIIKTSCFFSLLIAAGVFAKGENDSVAFMNRKNIKDSNNEVVLARVGDKIITLPEFYERAEYTIRPAYAKGKTNIEKKIILNSLIAEKLLVLERGANCELVKDKLFQRAMLGKKEQVMRQLLLHDEGFAKVRLDSAELMNMYKLGGRTYEVEFINIADESVARFVESSVFTDSVSFKDIYKKISGDTILPSQYLNWNNSQRQVFNLLFKKDTVSVGKVYGPLQYDDSQMFIKIKGWTDKPAVTENEQLSQFTRVKEKLIEEKGGEIYARFVKKIMKGKKLNFEQSTFRKLVNLFGPVLIQSKKEVKEKFLDRSLKNKSEIDTRLMQMEGSLSGIMNEALFTIDGKIWTVGMFEEERQKHPLVFRSANLNKKNFSREFKQAIVDMIQDKYMTEVAYQRNLDKEFIVKRIEGMFSDATISVYEQFKMAGENGIKDFMANTVNVVDSFFNPYIHSLAKKYSDKIEINTGEFDKIKLTSIDFMAVQEHVPYPLLVPFFPNITTSRDLDYGKKMIIEKQTK